MNKKQTRLLIWLLVLLLPLCGAAEETTPDPSVNAGSDTYEIILPAEDGFQSLANMDQPSLTDVLDVFISVLENSGNKVRLQGATANNNASELRYRTEEGGNGIEWGRMPQRGNEGTFSSTIGGLNKEGYDDYNKLIVISGQLKSTISYNNKRVRTEVDSWFYQLGPTRDDISILEAYSRVTGLSYGQRKETNQNGFTTFASETGKRIAYQKADVYDGETLLDSLMTETVFDGFIENEGDAVGLPGNLTDKIALIVFGDGLENLKVVSPDGSTYQVSSGSMAGAGAPGSGLFRFGEHQAALFFFRGNTGTGMWKMTGAEKIFRSKLYYERKADYQSLVQSAPVIQESFGDEQIRKGTKTFTLADHPVSQDLLKLYPGARLKVSDTVADELVQETWSDETAADQVKLNLQKGGHHLLTFRLMNGEQELLRQAVEINVEDRPPVFQLKDGEEILILYDTYPNLLWQKDISEWFSDPDGDAMTITRIGGDSAKTSLQGTVLSFQAREGELDGSDEVRLQVSSDTSELNCGVRLVWRSLERDMQNLLIKSTIVPAAEESELEKRSQVRLTATVTVNAVERETILDLLSVCQAQVLDQKGAVIANAGFDRAKCSYESEVFTLPDLSGNYEWTLQLTSPENVLPQWQIVNRSDIVKIANHSPESHPELLADQEARGKFGEQYCFAPEEWSVSVPEGLVTDPDGDPITYKVLLNGQEAISGETLKSIQISDFGNYEMEIRGYDHENAASKPEIKYTVRLLNLKEELESIQGILSVSPQEESYAKREKITATLQIDDSTWSERKKSAVKAWMKECRACILLNGESRDEIPVLFDEENMQFRAEIELPENNGTYSYQMTLENGESQTREVKNALAEPVQIIIRNAAPMVNDGVEAASDISEWVMNAETYEDVRIPANLVSDPDGDPLSRQIRLQKEDGTIIREETDDDTQDYILRFPALEIFTMSERYTAEITYVDNDNQTYTHTLRIELKNQKLLILIIVAWAILIAAIIALILYLRYRAKLPAFSGSIVFVNGKDQIVSPEISLRPWGKLKHLPMTTFAGSIETLLSDKQWEALKKLELRPDGNNGFRIAEVNSSKKETGERTTAEIQGGLKVKRAGGWTSGKQEKDSSRS